MHEEMISLPPPPIRHTYYSMHDFCVDPSTPSRKRNFPGSVSSFPPLYHFMNTLIYTNLLYIYTVAYR